MTIFPLSPFSSCRRSYCSTTSSESSETALIPTDSKQAISPDICVYQNIITVENLEQGLKRTKSGVSAGLDGEVKADYTHNDKLAKLSAKLKSHQYKPSPTKKVWIPKPDGGKRPLGISNQQDKIVQAAILCQLEPILEKVFSDYSMGFRPKRGCHNALRKVKKSWQNVTWIISVDITKYFDTIHHDTLIGLLQPHCDQATIELIRKLLKAGYVDMSNLADVVQRSSLGTPQGSLISPLLANLYLNELDQFVERELLPVWNKGDERKFVAGYQTRKFLSAKQRSLLD
jgi:group II intron reverse transcriptase/maturase